MSQAASYPFKEELANAISHGLGVVAGIVGLVMLLHKALLAHADALTLTSVSIYGASIIVLFLASTLYHAIPYEKAKAWLKTFDHCAIYLLIAGSYTPFMLIALRTPLAIGLMSAIWIVAAIGIGLKIAFIHRFKKLSLALYIGMGWLSLIVIYQLVQHVDLAGVLLLALGGIVYSLGVIFYVNSRIPFNHAIWHLFVLAGCVCHFFAIYGYIDLIPALV